MNYQPGTLSNNNEGLVVSGYHSTNLPGKPLSFKDFFISKRASDSFDGSLSRIGIRSCQIVMRRNPFVHNDIHWPVSMAPTCACQIGTKGGLPHPDRPC